MNSLTNKRRGAARSLHGQWPMVVMLLPFFLLFTLLTVVPIISSLVLSFTSYDMLNPVRFVGIDNFLRMFTSDNVFPIVLKNTLLFALITGPLGFLLAFLLAWFVNEFPPKVRTLLSFMFYSPSLVGNAYFIWKVLFSGDSYGYLNSFLLSMGLITEPVVWLKNPDFIAGLQNINRELYEAGTIDGVRNRWQELWYITLPSMQHMILFSVVMQIQSSFSVSTIAIELAGFPSTGFAADTIVSHLTDVGVVRYEMGYASAIAVVLFILMAATRIILGKILQMVGK